MVKIRNFEVFIVVDGKVLQEFPVEGRGNTDLRACCYVEAVDDANFAVRVQPPPGFVRDRGIPACAIGLRIDGNMVNDYMCPLGSGRKTLVYEIGVRRHIKDGKWFEEDLKFVRTQVGTLIVYHLNLSRMRFDIGRGAFYSLM